MLALLSAASSVLGSLGGGGGDTAAAQAPQPISSSATATQTTGSFNVGAAPGVPTWAIVAGLAVVAILFLGRR